MHIELFRGKQCEVGIVEHSWNAHTGKELITYQLKYPRFIHSEFMTHRVFSRNAGSSRAIPAKKLIEQVRTAPAFFATVGANQPGMQAGAAISEELLQKFHTEWVQLSNICADYVERWSDEYGIHKQHVNRCLEAFLYISVVVTATEWNNFFELRDHEDAQPEIRDLAMTMKHAYSKSTPRHVVERNNTDPRAWHLPYVLMEERRSHPVIHLLAMSAARCGRVSYLTHNKENPKLEEDNVLYHRLVESKPLHASPLEHQAVVSRVNHRSQNLLGGWIQHRFMLETAGSIEKLQRALTVDPQAAARELLSAR